MAQRRFHYEQAFEHYLRANRIPYVAVDEAKKSLLPAGCALIAVKSFDFVVYGRDRRLLIDVKGRMHGSRSKLPAGVAAIDNDPASPALLTKARPRGKRFESWVTQDDVDSLEHWQRLFGVEYQATFVFAYCLRQQPPDALFEELFSYGGRWYALREIPLHDYVSAMRPRSKSWGTVSLPTEAFDRLSKPFRLEPAGEGRVEKSKS